MKKRYLVAAAGILAVPAASLAFAQTDPADTVMLQCPAAALQDGQQVTCTVHKPTTTTSTTEVPPSPTTVSTTLPAATTTAAPTTTTTSSPATTTSAPTTTTPTAGSAFVETFSGPIDPARFTTALWRAQEGEPTNVRPSTFAVENGTLRIEDGQQNYGDAAERINQPFDFAGRTGKFETDVTLGAKDGWTRISLSRDPYAVTSYGDDNAAGQGADRGIDLQFQAFAGCSVVTLRTYANRVETDHDGGLVGCEPTSTTTLSHVTVTVSNSAVTVKVGSTVIGNFTGLNLGFSRGYWYLDSHNHATLKYANQPTWITHWDNVTFDGPVLPALQVAAAPMALVEGVSTSTVVAGVSADVGSPLLIFNARHGQQDTNPRLTWSLNGHTAHVAPLVRLSGLIGTYMLVVPVDPSELVAGSNTVQWTWTGTTGIPPAVGDVQIAWSTGGAPSGTTTTSAPPAQTTTTAAAPTTSAAPSSTTTQSSLSPTTTSPTSTTPTPSGSFSEDFASTSAFGERFDHGWGGEWNAGALFGDAANDWHGDHDMNCGDPNATLRTIHLSSQEQANDAPFYSCLPGGDPAKGHLMSSVNTEGYVTVWFSPKQVFSNVHRVCFDINLTNLGGGKWVLVNFLLPTEYSGKTDLGYTSPDFAPASGLPSSPAGDAANGVKYAFGGGQVYNNHSMGASFGGSQTTDKAARFRHCITDNENGTLTLTRAQPGGGTLTSTVAGSIPNGNIRVEFVDDNYNPDKHFYNPEQFVPRDSHDLYTWHWDNLLVETG